MASKGNLKLAVLGESGVGKTSLLLRFAHNSFSPYSVTTSLDFCTRTITLDGQSVNLRIWDTAGQERYDSIAPQFYSGLQGALLTYDVTDASSFERLEGWHRKVLARAPQGVQLVVVGSKCDLKDEREVTSDEGAAFAKKNGLQFFETSSKDAVNVTEVFTAVAGNVVKHMAQVQTAPAAAQPAPQPSLDITGKSEPFCPCCAQQ